MCDLENDVAVTGEGEVPDADHGRVFKSFSGATHPLGHEGKYPAWAVVEWLDDSHLMISYPEGVQIEESKGTVQANTLDVHVMYKTRK